ncbi:MAG: phosphatase PAP2 family protein [Vulcanimicrobiaceae bacterium]
MIRQHRTRTERSLWIVTLIASIAFLTLGATVAAGRPTPRFDVVLEQALFGRSTALAWIFTQSGFPPTLIGIAIALIIFGIVDRRWRARAFFTVIASMATVPLVSDTFKNLYARARPEHWLMRQELSFSYPSGHAVTAVGVFALWALFVWRGDLPRWLRAFLGIVLLGWAGGVCWSRVALGVHFPTDIIGGGLLSIAWTSAGLAICYRFKLFLLDRVAPPDGRSRSVTAA